MNKIPITEEEIKRYTKKLLERVIKPDKYIQDDPRPRNKSGRLLRGKWLKKHYEQFQPFDKYPT